MILADTSLWIQHFRRGLPEFAAGPGKSGNFHASSGSRRVGHRQFDQARANSGQPAPPALGHDCTAEECLAFIEARRLFGRGIGWNDEQLLVAARLSGHPLWSLDKRLAEAAIELGIAHQAS